MAKKQYNVYEQHCPSHQLLDIIGNKWIILIIHTLSNNTKRFGELQRDIGGISKKVLTHSLRTLEENGLVTRKAYDEIILKVEYSLTPLGKSLDAICYSLTSWAEEHIAEIERAKSPLRCLSPE